MAAVFVASSLVFGLAVAAGSQASAQSPDQQSAAQRCFEYHRFGAEPVDVAKTADGLAVLAQTSWNWHGAIGCYLTLDEGALAFLRAAPSPQDQPNDSTDDSRRCFKHHRFGESPVDVAKTADGQTVLARLNWGYNNTIGCYLVLDDSALATLRAATQPDPPSEPTEMTIPSEELLVEVASPSEPEVEAGRSFDLPHAYGTGDFSTASVEVADEFGPVDVEIIHRHTYGIVWAMDGDTDSDLVVGRRPLYSLADSDYCYAVTISGAKINDSVQTPYEYAVCILAR